MLDYNLKYEEWARDAWDSGVQKTEDLTDTQREELEKLSFLSETLCKGLYGKDNESMEGFLCMCLPEHVYYHSDGSALQVKRVEKDMVFISSETRKVAQVPLYAEDDSGRRFAVLYCDWRGPEIGALATVYDAINHQLLEEGYSPDRFPEVIAIYITDYDLCHNGNLMTLLDFHEEDSDPDIQNWRVVFLNAAKNPYAVSGRSVLGETAKKQ